MIRKKKNEELKMPITSDNHLHSHHSSDSEAKMEDMVVSSISKGLSSICFTEHQDHDFPINPEHPELDFMLNVDSYLYELLTLREKYESQITVNFGIEIGLQEQVFRENALTAKAHEFDYIIGSMHVVNGFDTYDSKYFEGKSDKQAIDEYFKATLSNIRKFQNFDALGHLTYIVRTVPGGEAAYSYRNHADIIDAILELLIENEKGLELNTSALGKGFQFPNPDPNVLKRYRELGGEIITIGSDAHSPENIAIKFDVAEQILKDAGFKYYTTFEKRVAQFHKL